MRMQILDSIIITKPIWKLDYGSILVTYKFPKYNFQSHPGQRAYLHKTDMIDLRNSNWRKKLNVAEGAGMKKVVVLPKIKGNGHGGFFVGRKGQLKPKHVVDGKTIYRTKIGIETHC